MVLFENLKESALLQHEQGDIPVALLAGILEIAVNPYRDTDKEHLVETLVTQLQRFNPYVYVSSNTSFDVEAIRKTVRKLSQ